MQKPEKWCLKRRLFLAGLKVLKNKQDVPAGSPKNKARVLKNITLSIGNI
jgi:hypothetical protein